MMGAQALAQGAPTPPSQARDLAIGVCGTCHGVDGNSTNPMFPRLAGQHAWYIEQQLKEFRDHKRGDPYAVGYMYGMASQLSNATIDALAKYFSHQKTGPGKPHPAAEAPRATRSSTTASPPRACPRARPATDRKGSAASSFRALPASTPSTS